MSTGLGFHAPTLSARRSISEAMRLSFGRFSLITALSAFIAGSAFASTEVVVLPRPDHQKKLLRVNGFQLKRTQFEPETKVVIFFYSASWCAPCKQLAAQLQEVYPSLRAKYPELEFVTFSVDHSVSECAAYLRESAFPWLAISPSASKEKVWQQLRPKSTPKLQAFELTKSKLVEIAPPSSAQGVLEQVSRFLEN